MKPPARFTFSLFNLLIGCTVAAVLLTVVGLAWRGVGWAQGASWALLAWLLALLIGAVLTGMLLYLARRLASGRSKLLVAARQPLPSVPVPVREGATE
jgi:hypothetical protein